ncbi:MAG: rhomboid family intramembrane serine protease [Gammaproteobacteria bacterium]|nr:rhomboid family intramembrane serine protease [Gammaproteobacteria bacterium]
MIPLKDDNPTHSFPLVGYALLGTCIGVFAWQLTLGPRGAAAAIYALGLVPDVLLGDARLPAGDAWVPAWMTVFTSMFLHGGVAHLAGNMLYLWIFADNVEDRMGHGRFVAFYLLSGIAAAMAQALPDPESHIPMVGASGAISGVLGAYLLMFPRANVIVLLPLGPFAHFTRLPALLVLGLWFAMQLLSEMAAPAGAGVAFRAHIGGFVAGLLLAPLFVRRRVW